MLAVNFFGFGTNTGEVEMQTETVANIAVESVSKELISSGSGDILLFLALGVSIFFAYFTRKFI